MQIADDLADLGALYVKHAIHDGKVVATIAHLLPNAPPVAELTVEVHREPAAASPEEESGQTWRDRPPLL